MERKKEDRSLLMYLLLTTVTCGIYGIIFMWNLIKDLNDVSSAKEPDGWKSPNLIVLTLLILVTCGFYSLYWIYKMGNTIQRTGENYGERIDENGTTLLLWVLLGSWVCGLGAFVTYHLMFRNMNTICRRYNEEFIDRQVNVDDRPLYDDILPEKVRQIDKLPGGTGKESEENTQRAGLTVGVKKGIIRCSGGSMQGAEITVLNGEMVTIGRDGASCNLILPDRDISRRHCTVQFNASEDCYYVTDYSSFGTRINGTVRLEKEIPTKCSKGSRIILGQGNNEFSLL